MKKVFFLVVMHIAFNNHAVCQVRCTIAIRQLQAYAAQVNQIYYNEYWSIIPTQRCPAIAWNGQYIAPAIVLTCRNQMYANLNYWYAQQCMYVNNWYSQIISNCRSDDDQEPEYNDDVVPDVDTGTKQNPKINTKKIENLIAGVDEEKSVKITIPSTAAGFKPE